METLETHENELRAFFVGYESGLRCQETRKGSWYTKADAERLVRELGLSGTTGEVDSYLNGHDDGLRRDSYRAECNVRPRV